MKIDALAGITALEAKNRFDARSLESVIHVLQHPAASPDAKSRGEQLRGEP